MIDRFPSVAAVRGAAPAELAAALASVRVEEIEGMPAEQAEVVAVATQVVASWARGVQAVAVDRFTECVVQRMDTHAGELVAARDAQRSRVEAAGGLWRGDVGALALPEPEQVAASMLATEFRVSPRAMRTTIGRDRRLVRFLPETHARALAGVLEPWRVGAVVQASHTVGFDRLTEFEARVYAADVTDLPRPRLLERARRAAAKADPEGASDAATRAPHRRSLSVTPSDTVGLMRWTAEVPDALSARLFAAVDALAQEYLTADAHTRAAAASAGTPSTVKRSVGAARLDALGDLVLANATVETVVELVVPVETGTTTPLVTRPDPRTAAEDLMSGRGGRCSARPTGTDGGRGPAPADPGDPHTAPVATDAPAAPDTTAPDSAVLVDLILGHNTTQTLAAGELERDLGRTLGGWLEVETNPFLDQAGGRVWYVPGPVQAPGAAAILPAQVTALLAGPDTRIRLRHHEPGSSDGPPTRRRTYRPGTALADTVRARDVHCRFPGCSVPANRCHLDHVIPYPTGETVEANLHTLCAAHHGFKHHAGWTLTMTPAGDCTWTTPTGRTHTTHPGSRRDVAA